MKVTVEYDCGKQFFKCLGLSSAEGLRRSNFWPNMHVDEKSFFMGFSIKLRKNGGAAVRRVFYI